jgi:hypothetical protein
MLMSEATVAMVTLALLLPPVPAPPLTSLVAPVVAVAVVEPGAVGVPDTGHEMLLPAAMGGAGEHVPMVTPAGKPEMAQVALTALAVADALLVHFSVPT